MYYAQISIRSADIFSEVIRSSEYAELKNAFPGHDADTSCSLSDNAVLQRFWLETACTIENRLCRFASSSQCTDSDFSISLNIDNGASADPAAQLKTAISSVFIDQISAKWLELIAPDLAGRHAARAAASLTFCEQLLCFRHAPSRKPATPPQPSPQGEGAPSGQ